jgi:lactoylglutathione lyase
VNLQPRAGGVHLRVELFVADVDRSARFYREVLGFDTPVGPGDERYLAVRRGEVVIGLGAADALGVDHPVARSAGEPAGRGVELVLEVDDVEAEHTRVRGSGAVIASDLADQPWGLRDFRLLDPDGYYLRITSR